MHTAVWKVGGSLFDLPDLAARLRSLLAQQAENRVLLVPGGGATADSVRQWQQLHGLDDEAAHWLALRAMEFNAHLLAAAVPGAEVVDSIVEALRCWQRRAFPVLSVKTFVMEMERVWPDVVLPHDWTVTSDSLAAWITSRWAANELVLVKSRPLEPGVDAVGAVERQWVDAYFPQIAPEAPRTCWCDLRADVPVIHDWLIAGAPVSAR
jgi:aspartokinase-like uncharacterized kinase